MAWFKVDDKFHSSEEVMSIPLDQRAAAIGLWTLAGAWSADQLKDGYVPATHLAGWGGSVDLAKVLVTAKLWSRVASRGFQFRNWDKWQTTREDVEVTRETWREKKAAQRAVLAAKKAERLAGVPEDKAGSPQGVPSFPSRPVPTQPNPTQTTTTDHGNDDLLSTEIPARDELTTESESLGIKDLARIQRAFTKVPLIVSDAEAIDIVRSLLEDATTNVAKVEAYVESACKKPDSLMDRAAIILAASPRTILGGAA